MPFEHVTQVRPPASPSGAVPRDALLHCLARILASPGFTRAPRMSRLLAFVAGQSLAGPAGNTSEYAIGIDVFDRDAASYSTCDDPIVRVQMGRLRDKLRDYYARSGSADSWMLSIPVGSYCLRLEARQPVSPAGRIALLRLQCVNPDGAAYAFATGLNEELADCLHRTLGASYCAAPHALQSQHMQGLPLRRCEEAHRQLEGSVRVDASRVRVALRLMATDGGQVLWSRQFDFVPELSIASQEHIAGRLCACLQEYLHETVEL